MSVLDKISAQQGPEGTHQYYLGEQLKDICRADPHAAELVDKDLDVKGMGLAELSRKMDSIAEEKHRKNKGRVVVISPKEAAAIIREFYGLPKENEAIAAPETVEVKAMPTDSIIDLSNFL